MHLSKRNYIIFDQLNPSYSKYFKKTEIIKIMNQASLMMLRYFEDIIIHGQ